MYCQSIGEKTPAEQRTRTLNERFATAADKLGGDKAAIQLAGVYAMAGLADDWEENRQTCINVLCGYLRMPYEPDSGEDAPLEKRLAFQASRDVRHTVIRVIAAHLNGTAPKSWCGLNLDFTGVVFDGGNFAGAGFSGGKVYFRDAKLSAGTVYFVGAEFSRGTGDFDVAAFSGAEVVFGLATFSRGTVDFSRAVLMGVLAWLRVGDFRCWLVGAACLDWPAPRNLGWRCCGSGHGRAWWQEAVGYGQRGTGGRRGGCGGGGIAGQWRRSGRGGCGVGFGAQSGLGGCGGGPRDRSPQPGREC